MLDFNTLLSPLARKRLEAVRAECTRAYLLPSPELGSLLLRLAAEFIEERELKRGPVYDSSFAYDVLPELARRLGARIDISQENADLMAMTPRELRLRAANTLVNTSGQNSFVSSLLLREACNGNVVVFAIDRVCPGVPNDREDPISRSISEVAHNRGVEYTGVWTPALMEYERSSSASLEIALHA